MKSLYGKLQLAMKHTIKNLKGIERIAPFDSKLLPWSRSLTFGSDCSGFSSGLWKQNMCTLLLSLASSRSYGKISVLPAYRGLGLGLDDSASSVFTLSSRNVMATGSTSEDVSDAPDAHQRIKFKRLDKTARHIMQAQKEKLQIIDKEAVEVVKVNREIPEIKPGYIVQLKLEVPENKRRASVIKGIVIARCNTGLNTTFRIRRLVAGVGVENLFHLYPPNIKETKVLDKKKVRRAKLYYLRDKMNALKKQ